MTVTIQSILKENYIIIHQTMTNHDSKFIEYSSVYLIHSHTIQCISP